MKKLIKTYPEATLRKRGTPFNTLARAIVGQQISVKAAQAVWNKTVLTVGKMTPANVLAKDTETLRGAGLSRQKVVYLYDLSTHFLERRIKPGRFATQDDHAIIKDLTEVKGIGRWTSEMFLIFSLTRPNVWPVDDIGLIRALEKFHHEGERLTKAEVEAYRERYAPWCTVATWYFWRSLDPIPVEY